jgi:hypothetical protein
VLGGDLNGFPNGRRLADDVVDIELKVLEGALTGAKTDVFTDKVDANDVPVHDHLPVRRAAPPEGGEPVMTHADRTDPTTRPAPEGAPWHDRPEAGAGDHSPCSRPPPPACPVSHCSVPSTGSASSHREAPYTAGDPRVDNTDVYAFVSPDKADSVTLVANWYPFQEPDGGPNFYRFDDEAQYNVNIDNNGDAVADVVYRWTFDSTYRNPDTFLYNVGPVTTLDDPD